MTKDKEDAQFKKFWGVFNSYQPTTCWAIAPDIQICKVLKDLLTNKCRLENEAIVVLSENCLAIPQKKMPKKIKDPRGFIINCIIGDSVRGKALADSEASINAMSYKLFLKLGPGDPRLTRITLQQADRSMRHPEA